MSLSDKPTLSHVYRALARGDSSAIRKLYELTSEALYGKLLALLASEELAARALKSTYIKAWQSRHALGQVSGREMQVLAAIAHQCALEIRFSDSRNSGKPHTSMPMVRTNTDKRTPDVRRALDGQDEALLKAAYLRFESPDSLAMSCGMSPAEVRSRLAELVRGEGGDRDE